MKRKAKKSEVPPIAESSPESNPEVHRLTDKHVIDALEVIAKNSISELSGGAHGPGEFTFAVEFDEVDFLQLHRCDGNLPQQLARELRRVARLYDELADHVCRTVVEDDDPLLAQLIHEKPAACGG